MIEEKNKVWVLSVSDEREYYVAYDATGNRGWSDSEAGAVLNLVEARGDITVVRVEKNK